MRAVFIALSFLAALLTAAAPELEGHFHLEKHAYLLGEPVYIDFSLTNNRESGIKVLYGNAYSPVGGGYQFDLRDDSHPEDTSSCMGGMGGEGIVADRIIGPHQTYREKLVLNHWIDFNVPQTYTVRAVRYLAFGPAEGNSFGPGSQRTEFSEIFTIVITSQDSSANLESIFAPLVADLDSRDERARLDAVRTICDTAPPFLEQTILKFATLPAYKQFALPGLRKLNTPASKRVLADWAAGAEGGWLRENAIVALGESGDRDYLPFLMNQARIVQVDVYQFNFLLSIGKLGGQSAVPFLSSFLSSPQVAERNSAMQALAQTGSRDAVAALIPLLQSQDENDRRTAADALQQLTHRAISLDRDKDFPSDAFNRWKEWWTREGNAAPIYDYKSCGPLVPLR